MDGKLDLDRIAEVIKSGDTDIVGLQEVDANYSARSDFQDQARILAEKLQMHYVYGPAIVSGDPENPNLYGDALLSRFPIADSKVHKLRYRQGHEPRVCLEAQIEINGKEYTFMVTHLDHMKNEVRIEQTEDIIKAVGNVQGPIILMGDFNCLPPGENDGDEWAQKTKPVALVLAEFEDSFLLAPKGPAGTSRSGRRIDYIFVSSDLASKVKSCEVIRTALTDVASDHKPVIAEIGL
jgi:endonuclease/exonuclease/phosphatase family metal-dependent hydrolase